MKCTSGANGKVRSEAGEACHPCLSRASHGDLCDELSRRVLALGSRQSGTQSRIMQAVVTALAYVGAAKALLESGLGGTNSG